MAIHMVSRVNKCHRPQHVLRGGTDHEHQHNPLPQDWPQWPSVAEQVKDITMASRTTLVITPMWSLEAAQPTHINKPSLHTPLPPHYLTPPLVATWLTASTWLQAEAQTTNIHMAFGGSRAPCCSRIVNPNTNANTAHGAVQAIRINMSSISSRPWFIIHLMKSTWLRQ